MSETRVVKLNAGKYKHPVTITTNKGVMEFRFSFNKTLIDEIKNLQGRKWDPERRIWTAPINRRNLFTLAYLAGENPYAQYDIPLIEVKPKRDLYPHQPPMLSHWLTRRRALLAADMGTGKSLVMIEGMEWIWESLREQGLVDELRLTPFDHIWYVGPRSAKTSFERELAKWNVTIRPSLMTYEGAVRRISQLGQSDRPPLVLMLDESSKLKTVTAQRTKAIQHVSDEMALYWPSRIGHDGWIVEATGTPSPKDPRDWWSQVEILCPGYLKEPSPFQLQETLGIIEQREGQHGNKYPHLVAWLDNEKKCAKCGQLEGHAKHDPIKAVIEGDEHHAFIKSINQVDRLYKRLSGLVMVVKKEDCLGLPEKRYELIRIKPTVEMVRAAANIKAVSKRAVEALTLLRELSDGFQYTEINTDDRKVCETCHGLGKILDHVERTIGEGSDPELDRVSQEFSLPSFDTESEKEKVECYDCGGAGTKPVKVRIADEVTSVKDQVFIDELEAHEEVGRFVVWGGFTGTIDRLVRIALNEGWFVLRVDGRGYSTHTPNTGGTNPDYSLMLDALDLSSKNFDKLKDLYPKVCFVGHPKAGGMGLTLTASPTALFFSNDFSGEARMQAEDRIHRLGMDKNRGATIKDIIVLPTDKLVLDNLKKKKSLQAISMGELQRASRDEDDQLQ